MYELLRTLRTIVKIVIILGRYFAKMFEESEFFTRISKKFTKFIDMHNVNSSIPLKII